MALRFRDRSEAGQLLATRLSHYAHWPEGLVLGLPRGGVPVAAEIAKALHLPLDVCLVRKLGVPGREELAMGAIASGVMILNQDVLQSLEIPEAEVLRVVAAERLELERREQTYRGDRPSPPIGNQTVILVDDGIATSATLRAAIAVLKPQQPRRIIIAIPVAPPAICRALESTVDEVVCLGTPEHLQSIGQWYQDFSQTSDAEVRQLLGFPPQDSDQAATPVCKPSLDSNRSTSKCLDII